MDSKKGPFLGVPPHGRSSLSTSLQMATIQEIIAQKRNENYLFGLTLETLLRVNFGQMDTINRHLHPLQRLIGKIANQRRIPSSVAGASLSIVSP